jgi:hypothetical protein
MDAGQRKQKTEQQLTAAEMKNVAKTGIRLVKVKDKLVPVLNSLSALP